MRNIKKILMVTLLLCMAIAATVAFSSCETDATPHVHEFAETVVTEATCTEEGVVNCTCACGYKTTKEIPAKGHTEVVDAAVPAECTKPGLTAGSHCETCGIVIESQSAIMPLGHAMGAEATCTEDQVCENGCGLVYAPATGHLVTGVATCTESADCVICGEAVVEALGHSIVIVPGIPVTCLTNGVSDGEYCDRCHVVLAEQEIVYATNHAVTGVVTEPTCTAEGYTTYTCLCGLKNYDDDFVAALGHDWSTEATECATGFQKACANNCGATTPAAAPVADSYTAAINNGYVSNRLNELILKAGKYGAWGVTLIGDKISASTEYDGGIGSFDEANRTVKYEFVLDQDGFVDINWVIASSNWSSATNSNIGITDMAAHMTVKIDGKPVDISGLALPDGGQWWNLQNFVLEGVVLEAGLHSFECTVIAHGGLNVGYMSIKSNQGIHARSVNVLSADIVEENGKVYYDMKAEIFGYTIDELEMSDGGIIYDLYSYSVENGVTTLRYDITQEYKLYPHIKADGKWYVNNKNTAGDVIASAVEEGKSININGRTFTIGDKWGMPAALVTLNEGTEASATIVSADLIEENGQVYWLFTYDLVGYYPEYLLVVDGNTKFYNEDYIYNADGTVTLKINVTNAETKVNYPHLTVMEATYTGAGHTSAGDILAPTFPTKSVVIGSREYKMYSKYSMPVVEVISTEPTMKLTAYDLVEENGKAILKLTFTCYVYDESTAVFFGDNNDILADYTYVRNGASVTYSIDITDRNANANIYMHMSIEGQLWNPKESVPSSDGNLLAHDISGQSGSSWVTKKTVTVNGRKYVLGNQYNMIVIGK